MLAQRNPLLYHVLLVELAVALIDEVATRVAFWAGRRSARAGIPCHSGDARRVQRVCDLGCS